MYWKPLECLHHQYQHVIPVTNLFGYVSSTRNSIFARARFKTLLMYWKPLECLHHQYQHVIPVTNLFGYCVLPRVSK